MSTKSRPLPPPADLELRSYDRRLGITLRSAQLQELRRLCEGSWPLETGGILIGYYTPTHNMAIVTCVAPPTPDSHGSATTFFRGWRGLRELLSRFWFREPEQRRYYLGEWHFHPGAVPLPSPEDHSQMHDIAETTAYHCPEPVLLIVGGGPKRGWCLSVHVYRRNAAELPLLETGSSSTVVKTLL